MGQKAVEDMVRVVPSWEEELFITNPLSDYVTAFPQFISNCNIKGGVIKISPYLLKSSRKDCVRVLFFDSPCRRKRKDLHEKKTCRGDGPRSLNTSLQKWSAMVRSAASDICLWYERSRCTRRSWTLDSTWAWFVCFVVETRFAYNFFISYSCDVYAIVCVYQAVQVRVSVKPSTCRLWRTCFWTKFAYIVLWNTLFGVTTCLANLEKMEMTGSLTAVWEWSGIVGEKVLSEKTVYC